MKLDGIMIWVLDVPATVAFYEAAFGLATAQVDEEGRFAMMDTGQTTLQFADEGAAAGTGVSVRPNRAEDVAAASQLAFVADDVHAAYQRAVAAGAIAEVAPVEKPWGQDPGLRARPQRLPRRALQRLGLVTGEGFEHGHAVPAARLPRVSVAVEGAAVVSG